MESFATFIFQKENCEMCKNVNHQSYVKQRLNFKVTFYSYEITLKQKYSSLN